MEWVLNLAAGEHTVKLKARRYSGSGTARLNAAGTKIVVHSEALVTQEVTPVNLPNGTVVGPETCFVNWANCCAEADPTGTGTGTEGTGVTVECCADSIPSTLYVSGGNLGSVTLTWDGTYWTGTATDGSCVRFGCIDATSDNFRLEWDENCVGAWASTFPTIQSCDGPIYYQDLEGNTVTA